MVFAEFDTLRIVHDTITTNIVSRRRKKSTKLVSFSRLNAIFPKSTLHIGQLKVRRWEARYIKGYELSGKIRYGFCYRKTYKEAKEKVTRCRSALISGMPQPAENSRHRFSSFCDEWPRLRKTKIRESTYSLHLQA